MVDKTDTNIAQGIAPVYVVTEGDVMLNASIRDAWPHVVDYPSWQTFSLVQHVSGEPGQEGEVVLLKKEEKGGNLRAPYHARIIRLEPERRIMWKVYPPTPSEVEYSGIVDFRLSEADGQTRFSYTSIYEWLVPYENEGELDEFRKQRYEGNDALFSAILPKLKKLVEEGA